LPALKPFQETTPSLRERWSRAPCIFLQTLLWRALASFRRLERITASTFAEVRWVTKQIRVAAAEMRHAVAERIFRVQLASKSLLRSAAAVQAKPIEAFE